jgi:hypothetical protein
MQGGGVNIKCQYNDNQAPENDDGTNSRHVAMRNLPSLDGDDSFYS